MNRIVHLEQRLWNRRQGEERAIRPINVVGGEHVHVRMKVHQVAESLDELDERGPRAGHRGPAGLLEQAGGDTAKLTEPGAPPGKSLLPASRTIS